MICPRRKRSSSGSTPEKPDDNLLWPAAMALRAGSLVAFPTETVYGLGADALNPDAVAAIFKVKGRPGDNPLIVHIASLADLPPLVREIPPLAELLFKAFSPGPLTLVLPKSQAVPDLVTAGLDTVAVRIPRPPCRPAADRTGRRAGRCAISQPLRPSQPDPRLACRARPGWSDTLYRRCRQL